MPLDIANPAVRAYQWSSYVDPALAAGYDGVAFDMLTLVDATQRCGHLDSAGRFVRQYSGQPVDTRFRSDVIAWTRAATSHVHAVSATATAQVNFSYQQEVPRSANLAEMTAADLVLDERGFTNWGLADRHVSTPAEWAAFHGALDEAQRRGGCVTTFGEEPGPTAAIPRDDRLWVVANYLLLKGRCTYMWISGFRADGSADYGTLTVFDEEQLPVGRPLAPASQQGAAWLRRYSGGIALVNPSGAGSSVTLPPGSFTDPDGNPVGPVLELPPTSGRVLLAVADPGAHGRRRAG